MSTTPRNRDICSQGIIALSRTYAFILSLPVTMFLEFLLEFCFHGIVLCALASLFSLLGLFLFFS